MLEQMIGRRVVVDLACPFVCLGTLVSAGEVFLELAEADLHDLRDTHTSRENYVAASLSTGVKRNRKRVLIACREVVAIALMEDIVED